MNLKLTSSYIYFLFPQALIQTTFTVLWKTVRFWRNKRTWNYLRGQEGFSNNNNTLNLNTIPLQITKKCFLGQGKVIVLKMTKMSQHKNTEPCENMPLVLTSLKKGAVLPRSIPVQPIHKKNKMSYLHLHAIISYTTIWQQQGTLLFPWNNIWFSFLIILWFLEV